MTSISVSAPPRLITHAEFEAAYRLFHDTKVQRDGEGWDEEFFFEGASFEDFTFDNRFDLSRAVFLECSFSRCRFMGVDLFGINLGYGRFEGCVFDAVNISKSQVDYAQFDECEFTGARLFRADLSFTRFTGCRFEACDLTQSCLASAEFRQCRLSAACGFTDALLEGTAFIDCGGFEPGARG